MAMSNVTGTASLSSASQLTVEDFLKVLLTQLQYQDPMKPLDNQQFMAQIAQFTTLEQTQRTTEGIAQLATNQAALQSVGLIGRTVDVQTASGQITGTVLALSLSGASPQLTVRTSDGQSFPSIQLSQVLAVR